MSKLSRNYYNEILEKAKSNSANGKSSGEGQKEFLKWIYTSSIVNQKGGKIRILPQKNKTNSFFFIYNTHQFKVGKLNKMCTCLNSQDRDGNPWGDCPICDFLSNNRIDKDIWKKLVRKQANAMVVYSYDDQKIYLTTVFMNVLLDNIIPKISELDEDDLERVDNNGFDLIFKKEDDFAVFRKINIDVPELSEIGLDIDNIPLADEAVKPVIRSPKVLAHIYNVLELGVNTYCSELSDQLEKYRTEFKPNNSNSVDDIDDNPKAKATSIKSSKKSNDDIEDIDIDDEDDIEEEKPVVKKNKQTTSKKNNDEDDPDSDWNILMNDLNS